jgi:hypothetical protein
LPPPDNLYITGIAAIVSGPIMVSRVLLTLLLPIVLTEARTSPRKSSRGRYLSICHRRCCTASAGSRSSRPHHAEVAPCEDIQSLGHQHGRLVFGHRGQSPVETRAGVRNRFADISRDMATNVGFS